eukprot:99008-Rhodomonas_salina.2
MERETEICDPLILTDANCVRACVRACVRVHRCPQSDRNCTLCARADSVLHAGGGVVAAVDDARGAVGPAGLLGNACRRPLGLLARPESAARQRALGPQGQGCHGLTR